MNWDELYSSTEKPDVNQIAKYINNPLWIKFADYMESNYDIEPSIEYSRCSMQKGWNIKYKKSSKSLCTLYPKEGFFIVLVVIGQKEMSETEFMIPSCCEYVKQVFTETETGNGQKWMMINVQDEETLEDIFKLIRIRKKTKKG